MFDAAEAIKLLKCFFREADNICKNEDCEREHPECRYEREEGLDMLLSVAEAWTQLVKDEPLTLDELRKMAERCEGVYVARDDGAPLFRERRYCAAVLDIVPEFGSSEMHIQAIYGRNLTLWEGDYKKTWVAYRVPPREVVHCKDCAKRNEPDCAMRCQCVDKSLQWSWETDDDYCSWGVRRLENRGNER